MYCELMMREEGFDTGVEHRVMMHTDAIWRACRIILDVKLHRGEIGRRRRDRLHGRPDRLRATAAPRPRSTATRTRPTYQLSYLLGRVLLLRLREDEQTTPGLRLLAGALP